MIQIHDFLLLCLRYLRYGYPLNGVFQPAYGTYHQSLEDIPVIAIGHNKIFYLIITFGEFVDVISNNFMKGFTVQVIAVDKKLGSVPGDSLFALFLL